MKAHAPESSTLHIFPAELGFKPGPVWHQTHSAAQGHTGWHGEAVTLSHLLGDLTLSSSLPGLLVAWTVGGVCQGGFSGLRL